MNLTPRKLRLGILIHGNKIWLSEFVSILFSAAILISLAILTFLIVRNELSIHRLTKEIETLNRNNVQIEYTLDEYRERNRIAQLLCSFTKKKFNPQIQQLLADLVYVNSKQFGYDPILLLSVIHVESVFNPGALGKFRSGEHSGAMGLMQLKLETAQEMADKLQMGQLSSEDLLKPEINLALGVAYLTRLIGKFKSFKLGLLAYNQGPAVIRESLHNNEPLSINYYKKVLRSYYAFQKISHQKKLPDEWCD